MKIEKTVTPQFKTAKVQPFGAHFTKKLEGVNNKLVCALSAATTCTDDHIQPF
jgi:hypothetical protein